MKKMLLFIAIIGAGLFGIYYYYANMSYQNIALSETFFSHAQLPDAFNGVRIVHFSDAHIRHERSLVTLENAVNRVNELNADIVIFTGNLFAAHGLAYRQEVVDILNQLNARLATYAVLGLEDIATQTQREITENVWQEVGFTLLVNEVQVLFNQSPVGLHIIGAAPDITYNELNELLEAFSEDNQFNLLLLSTPTFSALSLMHPIALQLSGHCLGVAHSTRGNPCYQFYNGFYQFADTLTIHTSPGLARFGLFNELTRRPAIHSFLLMQNAPNP